MQAGRITQCAAPRTLYERPESEFGGWFLGTPGMNFVAPSGEREGALRFDILGPAVRRPQGASEGLRLGIRPERARVAPPDEPGGVAATVLRRSITIGGQYLLLLRVGETRLRVRAEAAAGRRLPEQVSLHCPLRHLAFFRDGVRLHEQPQAIG